MFVKIKEENNMEEKEKKCNCGPDCKCGCQEGKECTCTDEKCNCGCQEGKECTCGDDCDCKKEEK
jgi:hypothetical protein